MHLIAENLTLTRPEVARAVARRDPGPLCAIAERAGVVGAAWLDINLGRGPRAGEDVRFALEAVRGVWQGGVWIDTSDPAVMDAAAGSWPHGVVLNGFSAAESRAPVPEIAARYGAGVVVFCMGGGVPRGAEDRLALAADLVARCEVAGVDPSRIWVDPVLVPLGWADGSTYNAELLEVLRHLPAVLGRPTPTVVGLSNLTTGAAARGRVPWLEQVFLAEAAGAGLTHALVDVDRPGLVRVARALDLFGGGRLFAPGEWVDPPRRVAARGVPRER